MKRKKLLIGWLIIVAIVIVSELTVLASYLLKPKATEDKAATKLPVSAAEALQPEIPLSIICQPQNRVYVPGSCITLTLKAQGSELRYQWYYKKPKQKEFKEWSGHTYPNESVIPPVSWNGIQLYCEVTDCTGNTVRSDTITVNEGNAMTVLAVGDSICRGARNGFRGFVGDLGLPYRNEGISGASLSTVRTDVTTIPDQLANVTDFQPDIIIAEGGLNDFYRGVPIGEIPNEPADSIESLDLTTIMGGMQKLFLIMWNQYPYAQHYFLINHKIFRNGVYLVTEPNSGGYNQQELHDAFVACCRVYNIGVIDIFEESSLDTSDPSFLSEFNYKSNNDPDWKSAWSNETDYVNGDGVHPLNRGYIEYYVPIILQHIRTQRNGLAITQQPQNITVTPGDSFTLSVMAKGEGLRYQWYYKKAGQDSFRIWKGHTLSSEVIVPNPSWDGIQLYCVITDRFGNSVKSRTMTVCLGA